MGTGFAILIGGVVGLVLASRKLTQKKEERRRLEAIDGHKRSVSNPWRRRGGVGGAALVLRSAPPPMEIALVAYERPRSSRDRSSTPLRAKVCKTQRKGCALSCRMVKSGVPTWDLPGDRGATSAPPK